jgi:ubiquinone biosynthesis protein COQ4
MSITENPMQLSAPVRYARAFRAFVHVLRFPEDTERVLEFTALANAGGVSQRVQKLIADPSWRKLYDERRALDSHTVDLDRLAALPAGTLGHAYATFMKAHGLTPDVFDGTPEHVADPRVAYFIQRMRQSHDLWHVVTNCETDPAGEIALQAFTYAQLGAPASGILAAGGVLKTVRHSRQILRDVAELYRRGRAAEQLAVFAWEDHWATSLEEVRRLLGLAVNPRKTGGYTEELFAQHVAAMAA